MEECNYHKIVSGVNSLIMIRIDEYYDWQFFNFWLGDESNLGQRYVDTVRNIIPTITDEQVAYLERLGSNLETQIGKWRYQKNNSKDCIYLKISEYIYYQFKNPRVRAIVGHPC